MYCYVVLSNHVTISFGNLYILCLTVLTFNHLLKYVSDIRIYHLVLNSIIKYAST